MNTEVARIAVIGLGYVGLPLAVAFAGKYPVIGFDVSVKRIAELSRGHDSTLEINAKVLRGARRLEYTTDPARLRDANVYIITAPTPINEYKQPDLGPLLAASRTVGEVLESGDTVVFESTVYPGATEEDCVPVLERFSGLQLNKDFTVGYSPERINPGDNEHTITTIIKVTSGSTPEAASYVDGLYKSIVTAGTHKASSIRVAEAAKVIENTQRDVNIALINELALLFNRLDIATHDVLKAASTKWNFLNFSPGLVGGHCIGVDPYYLTHKARSVGYYPEIILAGRRLNDSMGRYVASELVKHMARNRLELQGSKVLVLGLTFKENTPDLRNTRVVDIVNELSEFGLDVDIHDPWASREAASEAYDLDLVQELADHTYDAVILAVAHDQFRELSSEQLRGLLRRENGVVYDLKSYLPSTAVDIRL